MEGTCKMAEVSKPTKRTFWKVATGDVEHSGYTDIDQVTTAPNSYTLTSDTDADAIFPALPSSGFLEEGKIYSYNGGMVIVRQPHERTIYPPEETPALFSVYRANTEGAEWVANEAVEKGDTRTYNGKTYQCIQPHTTQVDYTPEATLNVLWKEVPVTSDYPVWTQPTGAHDVYQKGDRVHFPTINDPVYESLINANVWSPTVYPSGWKKL